MKIKKLLMDLNQGSQAQISPRANWGLKITRGLHCDADTTMVVSEPY